MEDLAGIVALALILSFLVAVMWIRRVYVTRASRDVQETIRAAIESGQTLTPETVRMILADHDAGRSDLRGGLAFIAVALGLLVLAAVFPIGGGEGEFPASFKPLIAGCAAFPGFLGVTRLFLYVTRPKDVV